MGGGGGGGGCGERKDAALWMDVLKYIDTEGRVHEVFILSLIH